MFSPRRAINDITNKNLCNIQSDVYRIEGIASNSASPTDSWILYFKNNVISENKIVTTAFMKIYINPEYYKRVSDNRTNPNYEYDLYALYALDYETRVYRDVIKPLIIKNICPNFVKYINSAINCTYKNLLEFLTDGKLRNNNIVINNNQCNKNLNRNISYMYNQLQNRPAVQDNLPNYPFKEIYNTSRFNIILNETINKPYLSIERWLKTGRNIDSIEFWNILFQICYGCYCMSLSRMNHNDLHSQNVYIEDLGKNIEIIYIINKVPIIINSRYKVKIYDFDRGFVERLGNNMINEYNCGSVSQCNEFFENKDIIKILCYVNRILHSGSLKQNNLLNLFSNNREKIRELLGVYNTDNCFLQNPRYNNISAPASFYTGLYNTSQILNNIISHLPSIKYDNNKRYSVYSCNTDYFNTDGTLNSKNINNYQLSCKYIKNSINDKDNIKNLTNKDKIFEMDRKKVIDETFLEIERGFKIKRIEEEKRRIEIEKKRLENKREEEETGKRKEEKMKKEEEETVKREEEEKMRKEEEEKRRKEEEEKRKKVEEETRRYQLEKMILNLSFQKSDEFLESNYIRNTNELIRLAYPIPQDIINKGRVFLHELLLKETNRFLNRSENKKYVDFILGENIRGITIQIIYDSLINFFNNNTNIVISRLREELGKQWVPEPIRPTQILPQIDMEDVEMIDVSKVNRSENNDDDDDFEMIDVSKLPRDDDKL